MSVLPGFDDLKPKDVLVFNANGTVMLNVNGKIELYQMQVTATGSFAARPVEKQAPDQVPVRQVISRERRLAMTDQGQAILAQEQGA
jgi:hypothetical protein